MNGAMGVNVFFGISGYLITESWFRKCDPVAFVEARFLRIMPALVTSVLVSALLVGPFLSTLSLKDYLHDWQLRWFILGNSSLLWMGEELPQVFIGNPHPKVVNGSLWTLPKEVLMYGFVLLIGIVGKLWGGKVLFLVCSVILYVMVTLQFINLNQNEGALTLVRVARYFLVGSILFLWVNTAKFQLWIAVILALTLASLAATGWWQALLAPWAAVYCILWFAFTPALKKLNWKGKGSIDISYGLYIYGYFVQQVIFSVFPDLSGYVAFLLSVFITSSVAFLSWLYIEKPAMSLKGVARHMLAQKMESGVRSSTKNCS